MALAPSSEMADMDHDTTTDTATDDDPRLRLVAWLSTDDAFAAARSELHRFGLDLYDPVDLLNDVAVRILTAELGAAIDNPAGYVRRSLHLRTIDLLRGERVRPHEPLPDLVDHGHPVHDDDGDDDPADLVVAAHLEDAIRRALAVALHRTKAWTVAAALSTLTLRTHPDVALPDGLPEPGGSATRAQADRWAALWLAGERDVFPDDGDADPAVRQARSRKLRAVEQLLLAVAKAVLGDA
jgi:DNA-directed RNA polymerase specialized sigma24 family protein